MKTRIIVYCGLLAAIGAILAGPLGIKVPLAGVYGLNITFGMIPECWEVYFSDLFMALLSVW